MTREDALEELRRCAGTQFDPRVVEAFVHCLQTASELPSIKDLPSFLGRGQ
jgi:HD-GYP domain-containing protein (c-di-GMP phosphodiesterase class II)